MFLFYKYGSYPKNVAKKVILFFYFTVVSQYLVKIGPLVTEMQNLWKKYVHFYLMLIYSKTMANIKKTVVEVKFICFCDVVLGLEKWDDHGCRPCSREQHADPLPLPSISGQYFLFQKMRNVLNLMQKRFSDFFIYFRSTKL